MSQRVQRGVARRAVALVLSALFALHPAGAQEASADAQMAELQTKLKLLQLQKKIDALVSQKQAIEKRQKSSPTPTTTDAEMAAAQAQMQLLAVQKQIDALKAQQTAILNPPVTAAPTVAPVAPTQPKMPPTPEDLEIQRLEQERQRLLKEQEIERLKKENAELSTPAPATPATQTPAPAPAPTPKTPATDCSQQTSPKVSVKPPKKASTWACQHLGVCVDTPPPAPPSNACPDTSSSGQDGKQ